MSWLLAVHLSIGFIVFWGVAFLHPNWIDEVGDSHSVRVCMLWGLLWPVFFVIWLVRGRVFG